jgi:hypothetical protein
MGDDDGEDGYSGATLGVNVYTVYSDASDFNIHSVYVWDE